MENYGKYLEIRWNGRVGQGVMTTASVLAEILGMEGKYVQAFPDFDRGENNPFVQAYNRLSDSPIRFHSSSPNTDIVAVMDPTVVSEFPFKTDTRIDACYIINTSLHPQSIYEKIDVPDSIVYTLDADTIYREEISESFSCDFPNIPLLTVVIHCIDWLPMESFKQRLGESLLLSHKGKTNLTAASSKIIERTLREVRRFPGCDADTVNMKPNGNMNTNSNRQ